MADYTHEQLAQLRSMIAKGVTSLEQNGEKVTFRSLAEMVAIEKRMAAILEPASAGANTGLHNPRFSRWGN